MQTSYHVLDLLHVYCIEVSAAIILFWECLFLPIPQFRTQWLPIKNACRATASLPIWNSGVISLGSRAGWHQRNMLASDKQQPWVAWATPVPVHPAYLLPYLSRERRQKENRQLPAPTSLGCALSVQDVAALPLRSVQASPWHLAFLWEGMVTCGSCHSRSGGCISVWLQCDERAG